MLIWAIAFVAGGIGAAGRAGTVSAINIARPLRFALANSSLLDLLFMDCDTSYQSMIELLQAKAAEKGDAPAYTFLDERDGESQITYSELDRRARMIAARLQLELSPGDRALLVYPAGLEFISAFFGCLYAGVIAVPATYPKPKRPMPRLQKIAIDCDAHVALSTSQTLTTIDPELLSTDAATSSWIATDELNLDLADMWQKPTIDRSNLAFLQYTSGSTSDPKGVMVSHGNLLTNLDCIRQSFGIGETEEDLLSANGVFWLPAYHDMGLIGGILTPLYMGGRSVLIPPTAFLQRPLRWLQAIHDFRTTISGAPNFAYEYCVRRTTPEERAALDLRHWRLAFCGAEPIRAETLAHFAEAFAPAGFKMQSFYPCYGLAECTLLAAGPDYRNEPHILPVNRAALAEHRVAEACGEPEAMVQRLVGCGSPVAGHMIVIVDPEKGRERAEGDVGEILIQGPSLAQGYWNRGEENEQVFGARVAGREGKFLRTGDLGFFRDGELYVTGRVKDVIIIRGRNHYPQDIEQSAEEAHEAVMPGAAFALADVAGERLVVVHQLDRQFRGSDYQEIIQAIRRSIVEHHELDPFAIVLIRQTSLPITSSGKVQRSLCRDQYVAGELKIVHEWTNPAMKSAPNEPRNGRVEVTLHDDGVAVRASKNAGMSEPRPETQRDFRSTASRSSRETTAPLRFQRNGSGAIEVDRVAEQIEAWLLEWLVARLSMDPKDVLRDRPFAEFGVDSLAAVELSQELEDEFKVPLPAIIAWNYPTPAALARYLAEKSLGVGDEATPPSQNMTTSNGTALPAAPNEAELATLLAEIENLSDEEAARLLADEEPTT
jgi:acyl-CoA synthetase (AMP-forming)/AMP-acid ligase II/acyl carrier protein